MFDHSLAQLRMNLNEDKRDKAMAQYIIDHKDEFPEWYMPFVLGDHKIPVRTYPSFQERPATLTDNTCGKGKWETIIKNNLPDLHGKSVCDIGCNIGIFSLEMVQAGAIRVDGFDRGIDIVQPNNHHLGKQSVAQQAYFVRNLYEAFYNERYSRVTFHEADLASMNLNRFNDFDLFFACCVLYHLGAERMEEIIAHISKYIPEVFLQANQGHGGALGQLSSLSNHVRLLQKYGYNIVRVDEGPLGYPHPVVCGNKALRRLVK